eukprot:g9525.t1
MQWFRSWAQLLQAEEATDVASKRSEQLRQKVQDSADRRQATTTQMQSSLRTQLSEAEAAQHRLKEARRRCKRKDVGFHLISLFLWAVLHHQDLEALCKLSTRASAEFATGEVLRAKEAAHSLNEDCERLSSQCREEQRSLEERPLRGGSKKSRAVPRVSENASGSEQKWRRYHNA